MLRASLRAVFPLILCLGPLASGAGEKFSLTIDNIMRGPNLVGTEPTQVRWKADGSKVYFQWKQASDPIINPADTYEVNRDGSGLRKLSEDEARGLPVAGDTSEDRSKTIYSQDGDLFLLDNNTGAKRQLTKTTELEITPRFQPDSKHITFTRGGNLYLLSVENGDLEQLTDITPAPDAPGAVPAGGAAVGGRGGAIGGRGGRGGTGASTPGGLAPEPKGTDTQELLKKDQREMFDVVRERVRLKDENDAKLKARLGRKPYALQARQTLLGLQLSPDGNYVTGLVSETPNGTKNSLVPNWITDSSYPEDLPGRPRVGDAVAHRKLVILNVKTGEAKNIEHIGIEASAGQIEDGAACSQGFGGGGIPGAAPTVFWSPDGTKAVVGARSEDNKNCWLFALDVATGKTRTLFHEYNEAWIGGPGGGVGWLSDNKTLYFTSEKDGFNHLYKVPFEGGEAVQVTSGKWEIDRISLSRDKQNFLVTSSEGSPYERHLWLIPVAGGPHVRLTRTVGLHSATLSPDEKSFADVFSYTNRPPELFVQTADAQAAPLKVTTSPAPEFSAYPWLDTPIAEIPARDGAKIPGHLYKPANYKRGGPAVIFVHGSGYLQNVHKGWSTNYYHEYLFHHLLMERGFLVLDIDYRASKGYGRDWRTGIYRHMGGKDLDDQVDAAKWLVSQQGVDPKKIGLYGGSYGGFITLMAMFTQPDVFAAGAALRPVSDWAYYNQQYSGSILNQPLKDSGAYRQSSPIYFAAGLKGHLLIAHGMVDTNVHFVDTVRLVEKLIELKKENWELAVYPVEDHAFVQPASWADEYKRILKLFEASLK